MSGSIVPVPVGPPVQLSGTNLQDCVIYNTSSTNAVWVSVSQSVSPNSGLRIGPLGTAQWSKQNSGPAWACVDSGVTSTINLNISNDMSDLANPVDVATATAIAILAAGVPPVDVPLSVPINNTIFDVRKYASIEISLNATSASGNTNLGDIILLAVSSYDINQNLIKQDIVYGQGQTTITYIAPTYGAYMSVLGAVSLNPSGHAYTIGGSALLSFRTREKEVYAANLYWDTLVQNSSPSTDNVSAYIIAPNSATTTWYPSYKWGETAFCIFSDVSGGSATNTIQVVDAFALQANAHVIPLVRISGSTAAFFETQYLGAIKQQPALQYVNAAGSGTYHFSYSQVAA